MSFNNWCPDCIHLKACRRMQKLLRKRGIWGVTRQCNPDCTAYVSGNSGDYVSVDRATEYAVDGAFAIQAGSDPYDVYYSGDLEGKSLGELIYEKEKEVKNHAD